MKKKRTYATVDVENFELGLVLSLLAVGCLVTIDVAKQKFVAAFATKAGHVLKLVRFDHPRQTGLFLSKVEELREAKLEPKVVMEPTGTYGDAVRYQLHKMGVPVLMMPPKYTHDFAEVADGVPSMHDAKAAVVLAQLAAIKELKPWQPVSDDRRDTRALLDQRLVLSKTLSLYHGHLEGLLARHWPELYEHVDLHSQRSWMTLLQTYPGPQAVAANAEDAAKVLRKASHGMLAAEKVKVIVECAARSLGEPLRASEQERLCSSVAEIERATRHLDAIDGELVKMVSSNPEMTRLAVVVGPVCAAAIVSYVGSAFESGSASAFEKAMGLNLKERSSGKKKGQLGITKRGPAPVRQLLYMATLRLLKDNAIAAAWYRQRESYGNTASKTKAVVAVMRKLARALFHIARGETFDATKLFDVRRLKTDVVSIEAAKTTEVPRSRGRFQPKTAPVPQVPTHQGGVPQPPT
jgi:transposase